MPRTISPAAGSLKSVQRGAIVISSGSASSTATISAVNHAKSELRFEGMQSNSSSAPVGTEYGTPTLTNATTVTASRSGTPASATTVQWEVSEFY